jgi:hypothetical protein
VEDPVFERLAIKFGTRLEIAAPGEMIYDPYVAKVKFWRCDNPAFGTLGISAVPSPLIEASVFD